MLANNQKILICLKNFQKENTKSNQFEEEVFCSIEHKHNIIENLTLNSPKKIILQDIKELILRFVVKKLKNSEIIGSFSLNSSFFGSISKNFTQWLFNFIVYFI